MLRSEAAAERGASRIVFELQSFSYESFWQFLVFMNERQISYKISERE